MSRRPVRPEGMTIYTDFWNSEVGRFTTGYDGPVERERLAPPVMAMVAVAVFVLAPLFFVTSLATDLPWWLILPGMAFVAEVATYRYARGYAKRSLVLFLKGDRMRMAEWRAWERAGLDDVEWERLGLLKITAEAGLSWADYATGDVWPAGDARITEQIKALEAKQAAAREALPAAPTVHVRRPGAGAFTPPEPTSTELPDWQLDWVGEEDLDNPGVRRVLDEAAEALHRQAAQREKQRARAAEVERQAGKQPGETSAQRARALGLAVGEGENDAAWLRHAIERREGVRARKTILNDMDMVARDLSLGEISPAVARSLIDDFTNELRAHEEPGQ